MQMRNHIISVDALRVSIRLLLLQQLLLNFSNERNTNGNPKSVFVKAFQCSSINTFSRYEQQTWSRRLKSILDNDNHNDNHNEEQYDDDDDDDDEEATIVRPMDQIDFGKFGLEEDPLAPLPPLPDFLNEPVKSYLKPQPILPSSNDQTTQQILMKQQEQIDFLIQTIQTQTAAAVAAAAATAATPPVPTITTTTTTTTTIPPLKVMLFIDGTWLYYSIHERPKQSCPIIQHYGSKNRPWQSTHRVDWTAIPKLLAECLGQQSVNWTPRPISIERAICFTSYKKDTSPTSHRVRMFDDMRDAKYDVYIMDTVGPGEKCVDIQLAVEMMHFATVPDAYDIAVLLSGDKDFLPALVRTRQKARKVALLSMRTACNRALYETPNVLDYDVIWMEDYIERWVVEKDTVTEGISKEAVVSTFTLLKVIYDYIEQSGLEKVSSRDIGRYLKSMEIGPSGKDASLLDQIKIFGGGLFRFLVYHKEVFEVVRRSPKEEKAGLRNDAADRAFWVTLHPYAEQCLLSEAKQATFRKQENDFFDSYSLAKLQDKEEAYPSSWAMLEDPRNSGGDMFRTNVNGASPVGDGLSNFFQPSTVVNAMDYSQFTVVKLKEICRDRGLAVSGTKAAIIERIEQDIALGLQATVEKRVESLKTPRLGDPILHSQEPQLPETPESRFFIMHMKEYLTASGGEASSRDVGRYLAAAPGMRGRGSSSSALTELKETFNSLRLFVDRNAAHFYRADCDTQYEFRIGIQK